MVAWLVRDGACLFAISLFQQVLPVELLLPELQVLQKEQPNRQQLASALHAT